ncbi:MAG: helix-turn-helix domain-containing protein [bacterium]|nr:helix-turn-helix domain-containing protein [bacterium]
MKDIGNLLLLTREDAGISLDEVSADLSIEKVVLENIEDGKTGAFSDVFLLRKYILNYAKYLGLDADKIVDEFNEYVFETTSKIPIKDIEKQIEKNNKNSNEEKIMSPYTKLEKKTNNVLYILIYVFIIILVVIAVFWAVKQITINTQVATDISYKE